MYLTAIMKGVGLITYTYGGIIFISLQDCKKELVLEMNEEQLELLEFRVFVNDELNVTEGN